MEYENLGIRHIAIRKKETEHYDDFDAMHGDGYSTDSSEGSVNDSKNTSNKSSDESDDQEHSDEETFLVSPRHTSSEEEEEDKDKLDLNTLMSAVDDMNLKLKRKEQKYINKKKALCIRESNFNLDTKIEMPKSRPSTSNISETRSTRSSTSRLKTRPISASAVRQHHNVHKLNISFSNDQVRKIDLENQRLLQQIIKNKTKPRNSYVSQPPKRFVSTSAINRARQQQEIEQENLRFLKRLQSVKPTQTLSKNTLLKDHVRSEERFGRLSRAGTARPVSAPVRKKEMNFNF